MAKFSFSSPWFYNLLLVVFSFVVATSCANNEERKVHIVYMGSLPTEGQYSPTSHHITILQDVIQNSSVSDVLVRSYKRSFNGFAAKLTNEEIEKLAGRSEVVSIFPSQTLQLHTTRSWDFMGFADNINRNSIAESDLIVGVLDTGIDTLSASFNDSTFKEPPKKWKGECAGGANFSCNNKIIGARYYNELDNSAMDPTGHGTHTASIAAGVRVEDASYFGIASGLARGGVPSSRIAVYKVCNIHGCHVEDILAGFDDAISDGVDILTVSLGPASPNDLIQDPVAIGSFHALEKGILTMQAAGNGGPRRSTVASLAPWLLTVAGSNIDRRVVDRVVLGNGKKLVGNAINSFTLNRTSFPLIYDADAKTLCNKSIAEMCERYSCYDSKLLKGKIVVTHCPHPYGGIGEAIKAGALGAIALSSNHNLSSNEEDDSSHVVPFPASILRMKDFNSLMSYINSTKNPQATIWKSEAVKVTQAPVVVTFSSRGPNSIIPEILKPDICGPAVDILAAFSQTARPSQFSNDSRPFVRYNILSGTSFSCPHVAGAAAYVKTFHNDWSPSAIKSALMTTAKPMNISQEDIDERRDHYEFAYGSGHVDPVKAVDPGLVYETTKDDYIKMLCSMGYNATHIGLISGNKNTTCPKGSLGSPKDLNYPSMTAFMNATSDAFQVKFNRTVTNVGGKKSVYTSKVTSRNSDVVITVEPNVLSFESVGEKKTFVVTVTGKSGVLSKKLGSLVWSDGTHNVRSPIVVYSQTDV